MVREYPNELMEFFRPAALAGTELMAVRQSTRLWRVFHERYAFGIARAAAAGVRYRGRDDVVADGSVVVREPGETLCNTYVCKPAEFKMLFIEPRLIAEVSSELGRKGPLHFPPTLSGRDPALYVALEGLCNSIEAHAEPLEQQSRFAAAVAALVQHAEDKILGPGLERGKRAVERGRLAVERAKAHLRERYSEAVSLEALADASGVSRFHLVHAFTREVGIAPHAYQILVRLEHARALLRRGMPPVAVAASVGFADQSHFARHLKRIMHVTPSGYARAMRQQ